VILRKCLLRSGEAEGILSSLSLSFFAIGFEEHPALLETLSQSLYREGFSKPIRLDQKDQQKNKEPRENCFLILHDHDHHDAFLALEDLHCDHPWSLLHPTVFVIQNQLNIFHEIEKNYPEDFVFTTPIILSKVKDLYSFLRDQKEDFIRRFRTSRLIYESKWSEALHSLSELSSQKGVLETKLFLMRKLLPIHQLKTKTLHFIENEDQHRIGRIYRQIAENLVQCYAFEKAFMGYQKLFEHPSQLTYGLRYYLNFMQKFDGMIKTLNCLAFHHRKASTLKQLFPEALNELSRLPDPTLFKLFYQNILDEESYEGAIKDIKEASN
jgi:hypothetical protein